MESNVNKLKIKEICLLPILGAIMFALKMAMANLPNIEPVSLLIIIYTLHFGCKAAWSIAIYVMLELMMSGISIYSIAYLYIWFVLMILTLVFKKMESPLGWAILAGAYGLSFGFLYIPVYTIASGFSTAISWWVAGLSFDALHGAGNFVITLILYKPLRRLFALNR